MPTVQRKPHLLLCQQRRVTWICVLAAAALIYFGWKLWLFREVTTTNDALGSITYFWEWGRPRGIKVDSNLDGKPDEVYRLLPDATGFYTDVPFDEGWLDADYDGNFEIHIDYGPGNSLRVQILAPDPNGTSQSFEGSDAKAVLDRIRAGRRKAGS